MAVETFPIEMAFPLCWALSPHRLRSDRVRKERKADTIKDEMRKIVTLRERLRFDKGIAVRASKTQMLHKISKDV